MHHAMNIARAAALVLAALLAGACVTPQIPLPPPDIELMGVTVADPQREEIELSAPANDRTRGALVIVRNERTGDGVVTTAAADGSFRTIPFAAAEGDRLNMFYKRAEEYSDDACGVVRYAKGGLDDCQP
jgi:hypothetical protein